MIDACWQCGEPQAAHQPCEKCRGVGYVLRGRQISDTEEVPEQRNCPDCGASGHIADHEYEEATL